MPGTSHPEKFARNSTSSDKLLSANEIGQFSPSSTARNNFHMEGKRGEGEEEEEKSSVGGWGGNGTLSDTSKGRRGRQVCRCTLSKPRFRGACNFPRAPPPTLPPAAIAGWTRWIIKAARHVWSSFARFVSSNGWLFPVLIFRILEKGSLGKH